MEIGDLCIVEAVAHDGCIQAIWMSGMDAQLVRTTGERIEIDEEGAIGTVFANMIARDSRFAMFETNHLSRSVVRIRQER